MTERRYRHDAFISYPSSLRSSAKRLRRDLYAIVGRHPGVPRLDIFLDTAALRPGTLAERLLEEVGSSRLLIVIIGPGAGTRPWVAREISHWQESGGSPEHLVLVEVDPQTQLTWKGNGHLDKADHIPPPLERYFSAPQKSIRYRGRPVFRQTDDLVGLCADLVQAEPEEFLLEETAIQRRRTRRTAVVALVTAVALIAAVLGGVLAVRFGNEARANADTATAQADAAEALLVGDTAPTVGIERVLRAAERTDSPTVRSAMLAVSQSARRLEHAVVFPEAETGHRVSGAAFNLAGTKLVAWSDGRMADTATVQIWDVPTGAVDSTSEVAAPGVREVAWVAPNRVAGCSDIGPIAIDTRSNEVTRLDGPLPARCEIHQYAGGVVALGADEVGGGSALSLDRSGSVIRVPGVNTIAANAESRSAVAAGPSGVFTLVDGQPIRVGEPAGAAQLADVGGNFLLADGLNRTVVSADRGVVQSVTVPPEAVASAPILDSGRLTGDIMWVTAEGTVRWSGGEQATSVRDTTGTTGWAKWAPTMEPLSDRRVVVVTGTTATVLGAPGRMGGTASSYGPQPDWQKLDPDVALGAARTSGADPVVARCGSHGGVLLVDRINADGSQYVGDGAPVPRRLKSYGRFDQSCDAVDVAASVSLVPHLATDETIVVRRAAAADEIALASTGDRIALIKTGFPIEILSTRPEADLPRAWDASPVPGYASSRLTALGERKVLMDIDHLVITATDRATTRTPVTEFSNLVAARPDGEGAVVADPVSKNVHLTDRTGSKTGAEACRGVDVVYLPGPDFLTSITAAEAQIPSSRSGSVTLDCTDGSPSRFPRDTSILDYQLGERTGRIVSTTGAQTSVTTWTRDQPFSLQTVEAPPTLPGQTLTFSETSDSVVVGARTERRLTLYRRTTDGWAAGPSMTTGLVDIAAASPVDSATLVLAVNSSGGFELFDAGTGRLVASDPTLAPLGGTSPVTAIATRRVGEDVIVDLMTARPDSSAVLRIPVGSDALRRQLCSLFAAEGCEG